MILKQNAIKIQLEQIRYARNWRTTTSRLLLQQQEKT